MNMHVRTTHNPISYLVPSRLYGKYTIDSPVEKGSFWRSVIGLFFSMEWEPYFSAGERLSTDNMMISGHIMRRRTPEGMIYRAMTEDESREAGWYQANQL